MPLRLVQRHKRDCASVPSDKYIGRFRNSFIVSESCFASSVILHYYKGTMIGDSVVTNALHACDLLRNHCNYKNLSSYSPLQLTY